MFYQIISDFPVGEKIDVISKSRFEISRTLRVLFIGEIASGTYSSSLLQLIISVFKVKQEGACVRVHDLIDDRVERIA